MTYRLVFLVCGLVTAAAVCGCGEVLSAECGNGMIETGEVCDDGNTAGGDSCAADCTAVTTPPTCGDGTVDSGEGCDDGNTTTETCAYGETSCTVCDASCAEVAGATSYCGDGATDSDNGEACDDGNTAGGDECAADCSAVTTVLCGNNTVDSGEDCDDGNMVTEACAYGETSCTVCDASCHQVSGAVSYCGDGVTDSNNAETCDDGNAVTEACVYGQTSCTVCDATCKQVAGATAYCGDGTIQAGDGEACDDQNANDWDGCKATCKLNTLAGMYNVNDGPSWSTNPTPVSCRQACAQVFGGLASSYRCSTSDTTITQSGYYSGWGDGQYCTTPQPDTFVLNTVYDCGAIGCSYSAYVNDHCGQSINFCWQ